MKKNILLVEYAAATIDTIKEILSHPIFSITVVEEGELAKNLLKQKKFDLVITAAMLPKFHGFSLSQYVAEKYPDTRIIIMSGIYKGYEYKQKAINQYKADDFFEKPLDRKVFKKRILELLNIGTEELKTRADISTTRIPRVDTSKLPTLKEKKEKEKKLTSEDLFGDILQGVEQAPAYEIELGDEPETSEKETTRVPENFNTRKLEIDIDRLLKAKPAPEPKEAKKLKKIEDEISKKFEDTLSGLGIPTEKAGRKDDTQKVPAPGAKVKGDEQPTKPTEPAKEVGDYEILGLIARGGMAEIYKAKKKGVKGFEKIIALKKILSGYLEDEKYVEMFVDEAKIAAQLTHPNIVQIYDLGEKDDYYFIAMEYVLGKDLRLILRKLNELNKLFPEELALYLSQKILTALNYAHAAADSKGKNLEIVHRDVSPPNILVSYDGEIKLTDFGVSKATTKMHQTVSGALKGKLLYMSPEQARGESDIDHRSDLYSAGIILFELLTGEKLFLDATEMGVLKKVQDGTIIKPSQIKPGIDPELENIILKALNKEREKRYQSAVDMKKDIESYLMKHYDRSPDAIHLSHFLYELFEEEITSKNIKFDLKPLPYEIKKNRPKPEDQAEGFEETEEITAKIELEEPGEEEIGPKTELISEEEFLPIIEIDLDKEKEETGKQLETVPGFQEIEELAAGSKKRRKILLWTLFLAAAAAVVAISIILNQTSASLEVEQPPQQQEPRQKIQQQEAPPQQTQTKEAGDEVAAAVKPVKQQPKRERSRSAPPEKKVVEQPAKAPAAGKVTDTPQKTEPRQTKSVIAAEKPGERTKAKETAKPVPKEKIPEEKPVVPVIKEGQVLPAAEVDSQPVPISTPPPKLTTIIKRSMATDQTVMVSFLIDHQGKVEKVKLIKKSKIKRLNTLIEDTVKQWEFKPAAKNNVKVKVWQTKTMTIKK